VRNAKIEDEKNPINRTDKLRVISEVRKSPIRKTIAPKIVGIASINENLDASFKFKPIKRAAVIAVPDLEAPGKRENT
jgi:hypothetical protein